MKKFIFILIAVFCMPLVFGKTVTLYPGDSTSFEGYNLYLGISSSASTLQFRLDTDQKFMKTGLTVEEYLAESSSANRVIPKSSKVQFGDLIVELVNICFDISKKDCARVNTQTLRVEPGYTIQLSYDKPELEVTRTYSTSSVFVGEEIEVRVNLKNTGSVTAQNIQYEDVFPSTVKIVAAPGMQIQGSTVTRTIATLAPGREETFSFKIYLTDKVTSSLRGKYTYDYNGRQYEGLTRSASISLKPIYRATLRVDPSRVPLDGRGKAILTIDNLADSEISVNATLNVPLGMGTQLSFSETIGKGKQAKKEIDIRGLVSGSHLASARVDVTYLIQSPTTIITKGFSVPSDKLDAKIIPRDIHILAGERIPVQVFFSKPNTRTAENLNFIATGFNQTQNVSLGILDKPSHSTTIFLTAPDVNKTTTFDLKLNGTYVLSGDRLTRESAQHNVKVTVYPLFEAVEIQHELKPAKVAQGAYAQMIVRVKNKLEGRGFVNLFAEDIVPKSFIHKPIITTSQFSLEPKETKQVYSYELRAPFRVNDTQLITKLQIAELHLEKRSNLATFVDLKKPSISLSSNIARNATIGTTIRNMIKITNSGDIALRMIQIVLPMSDALDLLGDERVYWIDKLDPKETVTILRDYRVKKEGNFIIPGVLAILQDDYENSFEEQTANTTLGVRYGEQICAIHGTAESSGRSVSILFVNDCGQTISVKYRDQNFSLTQGERKTIQQTIIGEVYRPVYTYSVGQATFTSAANIVQLAPIPEPIIQPVEPLEEVQPGPVAEKRTQPAKVLTPQPREFNSVLFIIVVVGIILMVVLVYFVVGSSHPKYAQVSFDKTPAPGDLGKIRGYIEYQRSKNVPNIKIEQELLERGWDKAVVEVFLK